MPLCFRPRKQLIILSSLSRSAICYVSQSGNGKGPSGFGFVIFHSGWLTSSHSALVPATRTPEDEGTLGFSSIKMVVFSAHQHDFSDDFLLIPNFFLMMSFDCTNHY